MSHFGISGGCHCTVSRSEAEYICQNVIGSTCPLCSRTLYDKSTLYKHIRNVHVHISERFICNHCCQSFKYRRALKNHISEVHNNQSPRFKCHLCDRYYRSKWRLSHHMCDHHGISAS